MQIVVASPNCDVHDLANILIFSEATGIPSDAGPPKWVVRRKRSLRRFLSLFLAATQGCRELASEFLADLSVV